MAKLKLLIYPSEFSGMISYLRSFQENEPIPLAQLSVTLLVLMQYLESWREDRLLAWLYKNEKKAHALNLPLPVARALHEDMQHYHLTPWQRFFLDKLDQAITNYRSPYAQQHVLGELIHKVGPTTLKSLNQ
jgi:hypothetical protein